MGLSDFFTFFGVIEYPNTLLIYNGSVFHHPFPFPKCVDFLDFF
jgi:hypothetical protein